MSWQDIIKSKKNAFPKQNLQLMKDIMERLYESIPIGTKFSPMDYWLDFKQMIEDSEPRGQDLKNYKLWFKGTPENWYRGYFLRYGKIRNYLVNAGKRFERI
tara:strand:- start:1623 stop:1928 length:306 start_codon:yes stop_codon:yes gene_type:complete